MSVVIKYKTMKENINYFSLPDVKRQMGFDDGLNDNVLIIDFNIKADNTFTPRSPSRTDALGVMVCLEGTISMTINDRNVELTRGTAAMILPNCTYTLNGCSDAARGSLCAVSRSLMTDMKIDVQQVIPIGMHLFHNPCFHLKDKDLELYIRYIEMIRMVSSKSINHNNEMILGIARSLMAFIHEVMEHEVENNDSKSAPNVNNRNMRLFEEFMQLLTNNFRSEHQIGFYADKLCLTPKYLSLLIKQTSGRSVSDWIDYCIITEAKSLLRYSDMSIQQVAYTLHFPTPSFFGTYFKRHVGMTPGDFRQREDK